MALSPLKQDGFRTLFFSPLASNRQFAVSTRVLRDKAMAESEERYCRITAPLGTLDEQMTRIS